MATSKAHIKVNMIIKEVAFQVLTHVEDDMFLNVKIISKTRKMCFKKS